MRSPLCKRFKNDILNFLHVIQERNSKELLSEMNKSTETKLEIGYSSNISSGILISIISRILARFNCFYS